MFLTRLNRISACTNTSPAKTLFKYQNVTSNPVSSAAFGNRIKFDEDCGSAMPFYEDSQLNEMAKNEFVEEPSNEQNDTLFSEI